MCVVALRLAIAQLASLLANEASERFLRRCTRTSALAPLLRPSRAGALTERSNLFGTVSVAERRKPQSCSWLMVGSYVKPGSNEYEASEEGPRC